MVLLLAVVLVPFSTYFRFSSSTRAVHIVIVSRLKLMFDHFNPQISLRRNPQQAASVTGISISVPLIISRIHFCRKRWIARRIGFIIFAIIVTAFSVMRKSRPPMKLAVLTLTGNYPCLQVLIRYIAYCLIVIPN